MVIIISIVLFYCIFIGFTLISGMNMLHSLGLSCKSISVLHCFVSIQVIAGQALNNLPFYVIEINRIKFGTASRYLCDATCRISLDVVWVYS